MAAAGGSVLPSKRQFVVHRLERKPGRHDRLQLCRMPLTIFDVKGIAGARRERIEAAVVAGGKHTSAPYEAWIAADPFKGGVRMVITGPHGFQRTVTFALDEDPVVIAEQVRETLED
jgi:hypothetical protein